MSIIKKISSNLIAPSLLLLSSVAHADPAFSNAFTLQVDLKNLGDSACHFIKADFKSGKLWTGQSILRDLPDDGSTQSFVMQANPFSEHAQVNEVQLTYQCDTGKYVTFHLTAGLNKDYNKMYSCKGQGVWVSEEQKLFDFEMLEQKNMIAKAKLIQKPLWAHCALIPTQQMAKVEVQLLH